MKLHLIYYKCLLDVAFEKFVCLHEDMFKRDNGKYVFGFNSSNKKLQSEIEKCLDTCIDEIMSSSCGKNDIFLIIGSCYPKDNLLLSFKDDKYFPVKLAKTIEERPALKWILSENDIEIDIDMFNAIFMDIFNRRFIRKTDNKHICKTIYVSHSRLDCYMMFKTIKWAYGNSNCINVWKSKLEARRQNIVAINDLIAKYIHNKNRMNKSNEFKKYAHEIKDFLDAEIMQKNKSN